MRAPLVMGNWKMNGDLAFNRLLIEQLLAGWQSESDVTLAVAPVSVHLGQVGSMLEGSGIQLAAQDVSPHQPGAYTGEVAAGMLAEMGCGFVIVGHSERRQYQRESSELVAEKARAVQASEMIPVVCVGETLAQREAGEALDVIGRQLAPVLAQLAVKGNELVLAYEPVWAIGTGKTATPDLAQQVHAHIRGLLGDAGDGIRILYGGSVKPGNAEALFAQSDIDGALVGGAALKADEFLAIGRAAS